MFSYMSLESVEELVKNMFEISTTLCICMYMVELHEDEESIFAIIDTM